MLLPGILISSLDFTDLPQPEGPEYPCLSPGSTLYPLSSPLILPSTNNVLAPVLPDLTMAEIATGSC